MAREHTRAFPIVAAWVAVAVVAVAVASWGVALVGRSVTDDRPAPLSAAQVEERLEQASSSTAPTSTTPSSSTTAPLADPSSTTEPGAPSTSVPSSTPANPTSTTPAPPTTTSSAPATTAPPPAPAGETRTYSLVGGTASLRFEPTGVTVVFANPAPGFDVEIEPEHGNGVKVEFESETHRSRVDGWWDGGPRDRTEEGAED